ncbi:MAG: PorT family protein [Muribaculaceae bacterium]|nr:PorT family protein [Muribaculaceae bacterium]
MKDKWLDEIRESLSDFEMDAPEGLWESLGAEQPVSKISWRRRWIIAAAVISIFMIGSGIIFWVLQTRPIEISDIKYAMTNGIPNITQPESNSTDKQETTSKLKENPYLNLNQSQKIITRNDPEKTTQTPDIYVLNAEPALSPVDTVQKEQVTPNDQVINSTDKTKKEKEAVSGSKKTFYANRSSKINNRKSDYSDKFAINISASGIGNASEGRNFRMPGQNGNDLFLGSSLVDTKIQHHMPFRFGLTLQYNITEKIAIESGLVYSAIGSDISISQDKYQSAATRRMHYVGIPLNVKFSAWSWKLINVYLSAGLTGEKCISNKFEAKSISDALPLDNMAQQTDKPFQCSANAAAGIQLSPIPNISIFAEPGVSYYFNDGTNIQTIYKDYPCNFNLNLGIRFTLNHR